MRQCGRTVSLRPPRTLTPPAPNLKTAETHDSTVYKHKAKCAKLVAQYRWVDKVYQAQVFNYGARAAYEIMVPTPAALFSQLVAQQPGATPFAGPAPIKPALIAADITESNWALYAERFGVSLSAPPPASLTHYAHLGSGVDMPGHQITRSGVFAGA